jgi:hypothetical protein
MGRSAKSGNPFLPAVAPEKIDLAHNLTAKPATLRGPWATERAFGGSGPQQSAFAPEGKMNKRRWEVAKMSQKGRLAPAFFLTS